jgi:uncharacterized protein DUF4350
VDKDVKLWVPIQGDGNYSLTFHVINSHGQQTAEATALAKASNGGLPFIGSVASAPTVQAQIGHIQVPYQQGLSAQAASIGTAPGDMPPRGEYLSAFHGLVVEGNAVSALTTEQRQAVLEWVEQGGHLVTAGGPDAAQALHVLDTDPALPARFAAVETSIDLQPLAAWVSPGSATTPGVGSAATIQIQADTTQLLAGAPERPLAVRAPVGDGTLTLLAADPALDPLRGWDGTPALLQQALQPALSVSRQSSYQRTPPVMMRGHDDAMRLVSALDALPPQAFPNWQRVGLPFGATVAAVTEPPAALAAVADWLAAGAQRGTPVHAC